MNNRNTVLQLTLILSALTGNGYESSKIKWIKDESRKLAFIDLEKVDISNQPKEVTDWIKKNLAKGLRFCLEAAANNNTVLIPIAPAMIFADDYVRASMDDYDVIQSVLRISRLHLSLGVYSGEIRDGVEPLSLKQVLDFNKKSYLNKAGTYKLAKKISDEVGPVEVREQHFKFELSL